ncbi:MAG TPA: hypothetical protein VGC15_09905 [Acetobacteraceae bacterium]
MPSGSMLLSFSPTQVDRRPAARATNSQVVVLEPCSSQGRRSPARVQHRHHGMDP